MKALLKSKKRVLAVVLVLALVIALVCSGFFFVSSTAADVGVNALWPENGPVVATIDGREYRYDPVYLYRLTGCVFDEDPYAVAQCGFDLPCPTEPISISKTENIGSSTGYILSRDTFWRNSESGVENPVPIPGLTMVENAVIFELKYFEQVDKPVDKNVKPKYIKDGREATMKGAENYLHERYPGLSEEEAQAQALVDLCPGDDQGYNDDDLAYCVMMNKAKFKEGQSISNYLRQVAPYIEKHALIASHSFPDHTSDEYRPTYDELMEKYHVEMVY